MSFKIPRCYDSHMHFMATGLASQGLNLSAMTQSSDLTLSQVRPQHFRGEWLVGFGWDEYKWQDQKTPHYKILDQIFPDFPVSLTRADGHTNWLNSKALERVGYLNKTESQKPSPLGGVILRDEQGYPTGVFIDGAKFFVDSFIPDYKQNQKMSFFKEAAHIFNKNGFTHIRDMSSNIESWQLLSELDSKKELTLYVDKNFSCENIKDFERALEEIKWAQKNPSPHLKAKGIKVYFDGALGSEGAFLSQNYENSDKNGFTLWPTEEIEFMMQKTWQQNLEFSIHTIGDQSAAMIVDIAHGLLQKNIKGHLNIEHSEILKPQTIQKISELQATCHMQPCHWLTDRLWLKQKLGSLYQNVFPWAALEKAQIHFQWGSDSPIEKPSVFNNLKALRESPEYGIAPLLGDPLIHHAHPDKDWGPRCETVFEKTSIVSVIFDGQEILGPAQ